MGITTDLAFDLYNIKRLSDDDKRQLRVLIIDFFAAAYAGHHQNRSFNQVLEKTVFLQGGIEESSVFFQKKKYPARLAAFMNSAYGHGAELDDGNKKAAGHVGVHVIPSVFALAEKIGSSNNETLIALATGYEAYIRISSAVQPGIVNRGFHSTGMAGTLACAAACAKLYGLSAQGIEDAIALATTMTGGLLSYGDSRPAIKPLNPGKAAENGLFAAMLAKEGMRGPTESLEGPNGWFHAVTDEVDEKCLKATNHLLLHDCYFKIYPSCRHTHCGIDAAIELSKVVKKDNIKEIRIYIYPNAIKLASIKYPKNQDEMKFSIQYTLACALINGSYGIADMDMSNMTEEVVNVIDKILLIPDKSMEDRAKGVRGTKVEVVQYDGTTYCKTVLVPKGDPENPIAEQDIIEKLRECAKSQATNEEVEKIISAIIAIDGSKQFINPMIELGER